MVKFNIQKMLKKLQSILLLPSNKNTVHSLKRLECIETLAKQRNGHTTIILMCVLEYINREQIYIYKTKTTNKVYNNIITITEYILYVRPLVCINSIKESAGIIVINAQLMCITLCCIVYSTTYGWVKNRGNANYAMGKVFIEQKKNLPLKVLHNIVVHVRYKQNRTSYPFQ